jgi:L-ribulose-5-phosphate 4-epimerase
VNEAWLQAAEDYMAVARRLWERGLIAGSGGNLSLRIEGESRIMIKPSGLANIDCRPETLLAVDLAGNLTRGQGRPSKDLGFHLGIYRVRPEVRGIVHAHVPWSTALTLLGCDELPLLTPHAQSKLRRVPVAPYAPSGSPELDQGVTELFRDREMVAALLERHGLVAAGATLAAAESLAELVEETAQIAMLVHLGGQGLARQPELPL